MHGNLVRCGVYMKEARRATKQVVADTMAFAFLMIGAWHGADVLSFFGRNQGGAPSFRLASVLQAAAATPDVMVSRSLGYLLTSLRLPHTLKVGKDGLSPAVWCD